MGVLSMNPPMSNDDGKVTAQSDGHKLLITVDRVGKRNSFTPPMFDQLSASLAELEENPDLWVGVLLFAGDHTSAGLDMPRFFGPGAETRASDPDRFDPLSIGRRCAKPLVMAVQGVTFTVAIEMMLGFDIVIAAADCRFRQLEPRRGIAVFGGAHVRYVQRAGWGNAMYHLLRADEFNAERALQLGLVQEVVPVGQQGDRAMEIADEICQCAPLAVREIKRAGLVYLERGEQAAFDEIPAMRERTLNSEDAREGIMSFLERREAVFRGR